MTSLDVFVPGTAKTKGSLRSLGNGRMVEQVAGSRPWRAAIAWTVRQHICCTCPDPTCTTLLAGYPLEGALAAHIWITFGLPKSAPKRRRIEPITRATGDVDKLVRNCFDALVDCGAIKDDAQIVELWAVKRYPYPDEPYEPPGARIRVVPATWKVTLPVSQESPPGMPDSAGRMPGGEPQRIMP